MASVTTTATTTTPVVDGRALPIDENIEEDTEIITTEVQEVVAQKKKRTKKEKKIVDENKPKRVPSSYLLFSNEFRAEVKTQLQDTSEGAVRAGAIAKIIGEKWKSMNEEEKLPWVTKYNELKHEYDIQMEVYYKENPEEKNVGKVDKSKTTKKVVKKTSTTTTSFIETKGLPSTPEGMYGPYNGYIAGCPTDPKTDKRIVRAFKNFDEAVACYIELGDKCGGITKTKRGYCVRKNSTISTNKSSKESGEISWCKNFCGEPHIISEEEETADDEQVAVESIAEGAVAEEPVVDEPVVDEPVADEPVADEPVAEEQVAEEQVAEEQVAEEQVADEPVADEPVADEPVAEAEDEEVIEKVVEEEDVEDDEDDEESSTEMEIWT